MAPTKVAQWAACLVGRRGLPRVERTAFLKAVRRVDWSAALKAASWAVWKAGRWAVSRDARWAAWRESL